MKQTLKLLLLALLLAPLSVLHAGDPLLEKSEVFPPELNVKTGVPMGKVGAGGPERPSQVHHDDIRAIFDILSVPGRVNGCEREHEKNDRHECESTRISKRRESMLGMSHGTVSEGGRILGGSFGG
ncbi:MAG: hypothetical protein FJ308_13260 [Planctomycetes bacterium]|nr:hypothetical protein [Planctomycetota bacterium]